MFRSIFSRISVLALLLLAFLAVPASVQAGGMCGGAYIIDAGDTLNSIAAKCGTSVSAITAANPGVTEPLRAGQTLTLPGSSSSGSNVTVNIVSSDTSYNPTPRPNPTPAPATTRNGTYVVQYGDTFSAIASRYGLSINQLWAANPQIGNINTLYAGQVIYIPTAGRQAGSSTSEQEPLSYGHVPAGTPYSTVKLVNKSGNKDIYVSLQGTTRDGVNVIFEYPVGGSLKVKIPIGDYTYVTWANEQEFVGYFHLSQNIDHTLTVRNNGVTSE
jgi:LysM repeat protein